MLTLFQFTLQGGTYDKIVVVCRPQLITIQGTNTYLIGTGPSRILLDTGEGKPAWAATLSSVLKSENATIETVLLTHWHPDHVGGVPDVLKLCADAVARKYQPESNQVEIRDGQVFEVEGAKLRAYHTPGHTADHLVFVLEGEGTMFTGDSMFSAAIFVCQLCMLIVLLVRCPGPRNVGLRRP